jgi:hypothetical protein
MATISAQRSAKYGLRLVGYVFAVQIVAGAVGSIGGYLLVQYPAILPGGVGIVNASATAIAAGVGGVIAIGLGVSVVVAGVFAIGFTVVVDGVRAGIDASRITSDVTSESEGNAPAASTPVADGEQTADDPAETSEAMDELAAATEREDLVDPSETMPRAEESPAADPQQATDPDGSNPDDRIIASDGSNPDEGEQSTSLETDDVEMPSQSSNRWRSEIEAMIEEQAGSDGADADTGAGDSGDWVPKAVDQTDEE